jgi:hypothetical protein
MRIPAMIVVLACLAGPAVAQESGSKSCVILKRMGPADEVTSHLYSFGIRGKQFQFVEGDFPKGMKFHGRLTDHDVREIMDKGGKVSVVEKDYKHEDLADARKSCAEQVAQPTDQKSAQK